MFRRAFLRNINRRGPIRVINGRPLRLSAARIEPVGIATGVVAAGAALYGVNSYSKSEPTADPPIPAVVPALDLEQATAKLKQEEFQGQFQEGRGGSFFTVRLASNSPIEDNLSHGCAPGVGSAPWRFWGVYDGHAGWATSTVLSQSLIPYVSKYLSNTQTGAPTNEIVQTIKNAFVALDDKMFDNARQALKNDVPIAHGVSAVAPALAGSCAVLASYNPAASQVLTACTGDSRVVLGRRSADGQSHSCEPLSVDQNGHNPAEFERLTKAHPNEPDMINQKTGRLLGWALSRAFGDSRGKWTNEEQQGTYEKFWGYRDIRKVNLTPPYFTAEPEVTNTTVGDGDFIILASDGLWDHISSENAVECVSQWLRAVKSGRIDPSLPTPKLPTAKPERASFGREADDHRFITWQATPESFVTEDHNAATHLVKNTFGGSRRGLFTGIISTYPPMSRYVRDDVTVQVVFFGDIRK